MEKEKNSYIVNQSTSEVYLKYINLVLFSVDDYYLKSYYVV